MTAITEQPETASELKGQLWLGELGKRGLAAEQIDLLQAIESTGSISAAAKAVGISYKTAWERVDTMNNMSRQPLVSRAVGGARGGGTALTDFGQQIVAGFVSLQAAHQEFLQQLGRKVQSLNDVAGFMSKGYLKTSIRNQFRGEVVRVIQGAVNNEVHVKISRHDDMVAIISDESCTLLGLQPGVEVMLLIEPGNIMLSPDTAVKVSARNRLTGCVARIVKGAVNSDVVLELGDTKTLTVSVSNGSLADLAFETGQLVAAFFKASNVVLLTEG
ncbi:TOBE domain-containing protein [Oceanobacter mangrovi]|uniref:TOBE domain-containing protein n=1 Tax=Oceanobacter mangrovi TaxID=2862510 RepID=UPI001C8DA24F|nr:TOBE domain-containing protein [Oceanobacter mangrovi]